MAYTLMTGAVGFLGRYVLRDLLLAEVPVAVLVRDGKSESAQQRVETVMSHWEHELGRALPRPVLLPGDIDLPNLGLDTDGLDWVGQNCDALFHSAAKVTFNADTPEEDLWDTNVRGTENVVALCRTTGIGQLHHVSTAFVCGLRPGSILESELDLGQEYGNNYEKSKVAAEKIVHAAQDIDSVTIYRPAIIVGDSQTGYTTTFHGFYLPLRITHTLLSRVQLGDVSDIDLLDRLGLDGTERKNVVPVDWVSAMMTYFVTHPELHGQTYHLTSSTGVACRLMQDAFLATVRTSAEQGSYDGPVSIDLESLAQLEEAFISQLEVYRSHWRNDPTFDARNTLAAVGHLPCPEIDRTMLDILSQYAIRTNFGWPRPKAVTADFDVGQHLHRDVSTQASQSTPAGEIRCVGLQVNGSGGGQWHLRFNRDGLIAVEPGLTADCVSTYYLNSTTFVALAQGRFTVEEAIATGRVVAFGPTFRNEELVQIV